MLDRPQNNSVVGRDLVEFILMRIDEQRSRPSRSRKDKEVLTASSAQSVRLVVTLTEAGGTLRCRKMSATDVNPSWVFGSRLQAPAATYSSWLWCLGG